MGTKVRRLSALVATGIVLAGTLIGVTPTPAFAALTQEWITQPSPIAGSAPDSVAMIYGSPSDAGLHPVQIRSTYDGVDVERFQILDPNVSLSEVDNQLTLATSGDPAKAKPAMNFFNTKTKFFSGSAAPGMRPTPTSPRDVSHMRFKVIMEAGTYYAAQITPGRVAATAKQFIVRPRTHNETLPSTSQTLKMEANNTFSVSTGGAIPTIRKIPLRVENLDDQLHFAKFLPVPSTTTPAQAANLCAGSSLYSVEAVYGIGTMSQGVQTVVEMFTVPTGRYIVADFLPNSDTGLSNLPTMCRLVNVTS